MDKKAVLKVSMDLLREALHLPASTRILNMYMNYDKSLEIFIEDNELLDSVKENEKYPRVFATFCSTQEPSTVKFISFTYPKEDC